MQKSGYQEHLGNEHGTPSVAHGRHLSWLISCRIRRFTTALRARLTSPGRAGHRHRRVGLPLCRRPSAACQVDRDAPSFKDGWRDWSPQLCRIETPWLSTLSSARQPPLPMEPGSGGFPGAGAARKSAAPTSGSFSASYIGFENRPVGRKPASMLAVSPVPWLDRPISMPSSPSRTTCPGAAPGPAVHQRRGHSPVPVPTPRPRVPRAGEQHALRLQPLRQHGPRRVHGHDTLARLDAGDVVEELAVEPHAATRAPQGRDDAPAACLPPVLVVEVGPGPDVHVSV